ncbi:MAG TPA: hypothetical protein VN240_10445, partial [Propylenella sp.]|nr:hypothetical protein [Propylenella sp.]
PAQQVPGRRPWESLGPARRDEASATSGKTLQELEERIRKLEAEVQSLRGGASPATSDEAQSGSTTTPAGGGVKGE